MHIVPRIIMLSLYILKSQYDFYMNIFLLFVHSFQKLILISISIRDNRVKAYLKATTEMFTSRNVFNPLLTNIGCKSQLIQSIVH